MIPLAISLLTLILIGSCGILHLLYEIIRQQGRILLRLDGMEERMSLRAPAAAQAAPAGLAVGTPFPEFKLPDLEGKETALEDFRGQRVFLVNWSPNCGYCSLIAPDLAKFQEGFRQHNVQLVLANHGDPAANRKLAEEHGLRCPILMQQDSRSVEPFKSLGTPVAYYLDEQGRVAAPLVIGAEQVPALAREVATGNHMLPGTQAAPAAGPGTELKKLLGRIGMKPTPDCPCNARAATMDKNGCDWCAENIDTIVEWLREEATRRTLPFAKSAARLLVRKAITNARRAQTDTSKQMNSVKRDLAEPAFHLKRRNPGGVTLANVGDSLTNPLRPDLEMEVGHD